MDVVGRNPCGINALVDEKQKTVDQKRGDNFKPLFLFGSPAQPQNRLRLRDSAERRNKIFFFPYLIFWGARKFLKM